MSVFTTNMLVQESRRKDQADLAAPDVSALVIDPSLYSRISSAGSSEIYDRLDLRSLTPKLSKDTGTPKILNGHSEDPSSSPMSGGGGGGGSGGDGRRGKAELGRSLTSGDAGHGSLSQRPPGQSNLSRRQQQSQQSRPTFSPPATYYSTAPQEGFVGQQISNVPASQQQSNPQYSASHGPYSQRSGYVGQYTIPGQPPPTMLPSPHQYSYSGQYHVTNLPSEANVSPTYPGLNYSSPSLAPPLQGRGPVYQYQRFQEGHASNPQFPAHGSATHASSSAYDPSPPSHSPHSPTPPSGPPSAHYPGTASYTPMHYASISPQPQYTPYHAESFAANNPPLYTSQYGSSYPQYRVTSSPEESRGQQGGTWWYIPPGSSPGGGPNPYDTSHSPFQGQPYMSYAPGSMSRPGVDQYSSPVLSSYPSSPSHSHQATRPTQQPVYTRSESTSASGSALEGSSRGPLSPGQDEATAIDPGGEGGPGTTSSSRARRSYHPHVAPNRSDWVMWVGNVPSDATHNELWSFFNRPPPSPSPSRPIDPSSSSSSNLGSAGHPAIWDGVSSIFLISRSNCAFVNFESEPHLQQAVARFNGQPLRPNDPRCPRLVCRVRRRDDDLRAGVGGQRGMGMHHRWVKEQQEKAEREPDDTVSTPSDTGEQSEPTGSPSGEGQGQQGGQPHLSPTHYSSSSGTTTSTNSSFLRTYFPKRYFILKSLSEADLQISVQRGLWATQPHNEETLNQAYRNSQDVFLIFGANKSGEFFGYARMVGPIVKSEDRVPWTPRRQTAHSPSTSVSSIDRSSLLSEAIAEEDDPDDPQTRRRHILSPQHLTDDSPGPVTAAEAFRLQRASRDPLMPPTPRSALEPAPGFTPRVQPPTIPATAPAEPYRPHRKITYEQELRLAGTVDGPLSRPAQNFVLNPSKVIEARSRGSDNLREESGSGSKGKEPLRKPEEIRRVTDPTPDSASTGEGGEDLGEQRGEEAWGTAFKIQWIRTKRLPFYRTRHIRNPWNHDREVKVSRDGTEIEPAAGQLLLDEWDKPEPATSTGVSTGASGRRGAGARPQPKTGPSGSTLPSQRALHRTEGGSTLPGDGGGRT